MSPEKTEYLFNRYPILYQGKDETVQTNLMPFGFECGDGWFELIDNLSYFIEGYNMQYPAHPIKAFQVKEKFGGLRFYVGNCPDYLLDLIDLSEAMSLNIDESTGEYKDE